MLLENAKVLQQREIQGGYRLLVMAAPLIAPQVQPGQFVHLRVPQLDSAVLRRPFSVYKADNSSLSILYKDVGRGTAAMKALRDGETVSLLGPLGHGFPSPAKDKCPVLVAGGYGMAALYLVAKRSPVKGVAFFGGRTRPDILCVDEFTSMGWPVSVSTEDGSLGVRGLVTDVLETWLSKELKNRAPEFFACGPNGMLNAVGERAIRSDWTAWLSMDNKMGCGVGACLTCVQKIATPDGGWTWERVCKEGPVFESRKIVWKDET
jgi:dihydroorotate dehydrogenase electron transfer subunit